MDIIVQIVLYLALIISIFKLVQLQLKKKRKGIKLIQDISKISNIKCVGIINNPTITGLKPTKKKKCIYLASPYSHECPYIREKREKEITAIAAALIKKYHYPMFLPITQSVQLKNADNTLGETFEDWKDIDLDFIKRKADEVWVVQQEGWNKSIGVLAEIAHAKRCKKVIRYLRQPRMELNVLYFSNDSGQEGI